MMKENKNKKPYVGSTNGSANQKGVTSNTLCIAGQPPCFIILYASTMWKCRVRL